MTIRRANYRYTVEIHEFGVYRIIGKERLL